MTRKKSKALALAVMCAILAGGYGAVNPVYAVDDINLIDKGTKINGTLQVKDRLTLYQPASDSPSDFVEYLDIERLGRINNLISYSTSGTQTVITAGNGSTIGGVGFNTGALTGVTSINAGASNSKFSINENGTISAAGGKFKVDENKIKLGYLTINATNDGVTFTDTNRDNSFTIADVIDIKRTTKALATGYKSYGNVMDTFTSLGGKLRVYDKRKEGSGGDASETSLDLVTINEGYQNQVAMDTVNGIVISHQGNDNHATTAAMNEKGVFAGGKDYATAKASMSNADGSLKAASGKFTVDKDGAIKAANGEFNVGADGKLTGANGSKIGGITFSGGQLSSGTASVNVSDLAADHEIITKDTQYTYSSKTVKSKIDSLEQSGTNLSSQIQKIERFTNQENNKEGTSIAGNLNVYDDGTVIINDNDDKVATVTIDRNRISIGNVSLIKNDYVEKDGTIHYNQTINDYAKLDVKKGKIGYKVGNYSVTTSSATATGDYNIDQANKGTVFSNDTNYTRIDGAEINSVSGKNTGVLGGSWLELTHENGSKAVLRQGGLILTGINGLETKLEDGILSYGTSSIMVSDLVNVKNLANGIDDRIKGIQRDTTGTATTIEGKLKVASDGTVKINEGEDQQVIIDSNGIKVGKNSSRMNDSKGFATTKDLYVGTTDADNPTEDNSKFYVNGSDGSLKAANGKFTVDAQGNTNVEGTLTTKKLVTDELVITGSGAAGGLMGGSIAFGGNGTIKSDIKDGNKNTHFTTEIDGVTTEVKDGLKTTTNTVNASGNTNTVTAGTSTSKRNQTATSITDTVGANSVTTDANGTTFKNETSPTDSTTTTIKGSAITSTKGTGTGTLDGSTMTLTEGSNTTKLTAGSATFTKDGKTTTISGETITVTDAVDGVSKEFSLSDVADATTDIAGLKNGSQIDVIGYSQKLGVGQVVEGNTGLVNGGTVYGAINELKETMGMGFITVSDGAVAVAKDSDATKVNIAGKGGNRVLTGVETDVSDLSSAANVGYVHSQTQALESRMNAMGAKLSDEAKNAGAVGAALAGLHHLDYDPDNKLDVAASVGHYRGKSAGAMGVFYQPNETMMISAGATIGGDDNAYNAGLSFKIGKGSSSGSTSKAAMAAEIRQLKADKDAQAAEIQELKEQVALLMQKMERSDTGEK